jgi:hypothetical protein
MTALGKKVGSTLYIGYLPILLGVSQLPYETVRDVRRGRHQLPDDFRLDLVCIERTRRIRYIQLSSLVEPHPHAVKAFTFCPIELRAKIELGRCRGQIYHRLDTILTPHHLRYPYYKAVTQFEECSGLLGPQAPAGIGSRRVWDQWVEQHMPLSTYKRVMDDILFAHPGL